jgi:hypothetical protein
LRPQAGGTCTFPMVQSPNGTSRSSPAAYGGTHPACHEGWSWPVSSGKGRLTPPIRPAEPHTAADGGPQWFVAHGCMCRSVLVPPAAERGAFGFFQKSRRSFPHLLYSQGVLTWRLSSMWSFPHWSSVSRLGCPADSREPPVSWSPCPWQPCSYCLWRTSNTRTRRKPSNLPRVSSSPSLSSCCFSCRLCSPFDVACHSG